METITKIAAQNLDGSHFRPYLLSRTAVPAEIAGHTVKRHNTRHYLLADIALVGEAITLAMRTNTAGQGS